MKTERRRGTGPIAFVSRLRSKVRNSLPGAPTRRLWRAAREARKPWWTFVHGYVYGRWPYGYIGSAIGERRGLFPLRILFAPFLLKALFPQKWAAGYHGKVLPTEAAARLVQVKEDVRTVVSEQVIPFETCRDLVLSHPDHIVVLDCPCRVSRQDPCLPLDVCLIVGEPFASFVLEHHPHKWRAITPEEATQILTAEADRGHVHHAFFKEAMLGRFYAICNCCSCCCGAMHAHRSGTPMLISSGYVADVEVTACQACGTCAQVCPFGAITVLDYAMVDMAVCMGCGVCVSKCPQEAISLRREPSKGEPLDVQEVIAHAAQLT